MNINDNILKLLYQQSINTNKTKSASVTDFSSKDVANDKDSFMSILEEVIYANSLGTTENIDNLISIGADENDQDDLLLSMLLALQQENGFSYSEHINIDEILNGLRNSDELSIDALNSIEIGLQPQIISSVSEDLIKSLGDLKDKLPGKGIDIENYADIDTNEETINIKADYSRNFPKEIMDSMNAARQAHEMMRARIQQIRNVANRNDTGEVYSTTGNLADAEIQALNVSLIPADTIIASSTMLDMENLTNAQLLSNGTSLENIEEAFNSKDDKLKFELVNENIINNSLKKTTDVYADNKIAEVNPESSLRENVFEQIKEQVLMMKEDNKQTVTMQLRPEELGKLDIKMIFERGNLSVEILTSNEKAHSLILSNISELESILKNNTLSDKNFMNFENTRQLSEENARQNNQGYNHRNSEQQQEQGEAKSGQDKFLITELDNNEKLDFYTSFSKIREARAKMFETA